MVIQSHVVNWIQFKADFLYILLGSGHVLSCGLLLFDALSIGCFVFKSRIKRKDEVDWKGYHENKIFESDKREPNECEAKEKSSLVNGNK